VLASGHVAEAAPPSGDASAAKPVDGRLRGPDYTAEVNDVAWPETVMSPSGINDVAGDDHRLVAFALSVTQETIDSGLLNGPTAASASIVTGTKHAGTLGEVSMSRIDQQIAGGPSGSAETTGTDSFVVSVPVADERSVRLELDEDGFTQRFDLWNLERVPPSPVVLYRDPSSSAVTGTPSGPFHLNFSNPDDGFTSSDDVSVASAVLSAFAPDGPGNTQNNPNIAYLVLGLRSSYPNTQYGDPNWGHFFSGFTPLPGNQLSFTPTGGAAVMASANTSSFSSTDAAPDDDGLFDAVYSFPVPASTTGGTLSVSAGAVTGFEYVGFDGAGGSGPVDITTPAGATISFPPLPARASAQRRPSWFGAPLPATGQAAASASGSGHPASIAPSGGFPIWLAVLLLLVVAAGALAFERWRRTRTTRLAVSGNSAAMVSVVADRPTGRSEDPLVVEPDAVPAPDVRTEIGDVAGTEDNEAQDVGVEDGVITDECAPFRVEAMGPIQVTGWRQRSDRRIIEELAVYLTFHDSHHRNAEQIQTGIWPNPGRHDDVARKTFHTYLSLLRTCVGVDHLPDASVAGGYLICDVECDWTEFKDLVRQADAGGGDEALSLRRRALDLLRGKPFEGVPVDTYEWVGAEHLTSTMTIAVARCVARLGDDLLERGDFVGAEEVARIGRLGAPEDYGVWALGARAIDARRDRSALRLWLTDAAEHLEAPEIRRIQDDLGPHDDDPEDPEAEAT
jgi:hypothetical protein